MSCRGLTNCDVYINALKFEFPFRIFSKARALSLLPSALVNMKLITSAYAAASTDLKHRLFGTSSLVRHENPLVGVTVVLASVCLRITTDIRRVSPENLYQVLRPRCHVKAAQYRRGLYLM